MIKKIRQLIDEYRFNIKEQKLYNSKLKGQIAELDWANIFHDTIRDKPWLQTISLSPGRWAGGYPLLYLLVRILGECKPKSIIEFGLGESSKIISSFLSNELFETRHLILENNPDWQNHFGKRFKLHKNSIIKILPLETKLYNSQTYNGYQGIETIDGKFDLYLVDGPLGSQKYSRFDIFCLVDRLGSEDEFIIIIDDYHRKGEFETFMELKKLFTAKNILFHSAQYSGKKSSAVITSKGFNWITSL